MQCIGEKGHKDKQKIDKLEIQIVILQPDLMNNSSENTISQIENLKAKLDSINNTKVKLKMLNDRIAFYKDYKNV